MTLRPRAYEPLPVPYRFADIPDEAAGPDVGTQVPNPLRATGVFVVHGIGLQQFPETSVTLRLGFDDAIADIARHSPNYLIPPPVTEEGYWGDYTSFEETFGQEWTASTGRERTFFSALWKRRTIDPPGTAKWFVAQNLRLFRLRTVRELGLGHGLALMAAAPATVASAAMMLVRHPKILGEVLGDVRVYCDPHGNVEDAIVQRIDRRVGERFLQMLGLDWDFQDLPKDRWLVYSGAPHRFAYVTWVAHSLGTVISCNVIGDLLTRAQELEAQLARGATKRADAPEPAADARLRANIARVRRGLHRFITLGSPLEQIDVLFPGALRPWPAAAGRTMGARASGADRARAWWVNFYHVLDPVSSPLTAPRFRTLVENRHGRILRIPGLAHIAYWRDRSILKYVVSRTYGRDLYPWPDPDFPSERVCRALRYVVGWITLGVLAGASVGLTLWLVRGGAMSLLRTAVAWWPF